MSDRLLKMVSDLYAGLRVLEEAVREEPDPVKTEQPERFEHRDIDGDRVLVYPHDYPEYQSVLMVETDRNSVRLSQDAVNGLAQYLDRYRTDVPCPKIVGIPEGEECAGTQHHDGPCSPNADDIGALVTYPLPTGFDRERGCGRGSNHPGHEYHSRESSFRCLGVRNGVYGA